ncbi:hypothetical protein HUJ05_000843 [Dendroctonus ponderosae]|nr:hypothetical protein HUJ05_000843 [Dendroctonus ponderosae]
MNLLIHFTSMSKWLMFLMARKLMNINIKTTFSEWSTESKYAMGKYAIYFAFCSISKCCSILQSTKAHRFSKRVKWDGIGGDSRRGSVRLLRQSKEMKYSSLSTTRSVIKLNYKIIKIRSIHINILCVPNKRDFGKCSDLWTVQSCWLFWRCMSFSSPPRYLKIYIKATNSPTKTLMDNQSCTVARSIQFNIRHMQNYVYDLISYVPDKYIFICSEVSQSAKIKVSNCDANRDLVNVNSE